MTTCQTINHYAGFESDHRAYNPGLITRIDFICPRDGKIIVNKWPSGWEAMPVELQHEEHDAFDMEAALSWCENHCWEVRRWRGGARAFKYGLRPIRNASLIKRMRSDLSVHPRPELLGKAVALDLRYDL